MARRIVGKEGNVRGDKAQILASYWVFLSYPTEQIGVVEGVE